MRAKSAPSIEALETRTLLAQEVVKDINPGTTSLATPQNMTDVNGTLYFVGLGRLMKSDGTQAGTVTVGGEDVLNPSDLCNANGTLYFSVDGRLWKSDGTDAGTVKVTPTLMYARTITAAGSSVFFRGYDGNGEELWTSDGTEGGTYRVRDINPGAASSEPRQMTNVNGVLMFRANDGSAGEELWRSDGTEAGTYRVKDIHVGASGSGSVSYTNANGTLFFVAHDAADQGYELWKSNGTESGTVRVKDIRPGKPGSSPTFLRDVGGTLMFVATDGISGFELWKSDGTEAGTVIVKDLIAGGGSANLDHLTAVGSTLFFTADVGDGSGYELWKSDGTAAGTGRVKDIYAGAASSFPGAMIGWNDKLCFTAQDGTGGGPVAFEVWVSDGTAGGTNKLGGAFRFSQSNLRGAGNRLYFIADEGNGSTLFTSDGTGAGTHSLPLVNNFTGHGSGIGKIVRVGQTLFFNAWDGVNGFELWKSDGTTAGTQMVVDLQPGGWSTNPQELINFNGTLYFTALGKLYKSDGTAGGTIPVTDVAMSPSKLTVVGGNMLYFLGNDGGGQEIWKSDGTAAGTARVADVRPGGQGSAADFFTDVDGTLYFIADDGTHGHEVFKTDGVTTTLVKDIIPGAQSSGPLQLTAAGDRLYFRAGDGEHGWELWTSDGTAAGTRMVKDVLPGAESSVVHLITPVGDTVYFVAADGIHGQELWKSDGTEAGTMLVRDIATGSRGSTPLSLTAFNGQLYFRADDGPHGAELWKSDGSEAGTQIVKHIRTGDAPTYLDAMSVIDGRLIFNAVGNLGTHRIWVSDGTTAGTYATDGTPTVVRDRTILNDYLYYASWHPPVSDELRRQDLNPGVPEPASDPSPATTPSAASSAAASIAPAALDSEDVFYEAIFTGGKPSPSTFASIGMQSALVTGGWFGDSTGLYPDESVARANARQAWAENRSLIIDIEHFPIDRRSQPEGAVQHALERLTLLVDWINDERPGVKVGFFGLMPADGTPAPTPGSSGYASWVASTARMASLIEKVDELYPGIYTLYPGAQAAWTAGAESMIALARTYGKPVRPFYWPQYLQFFPDNTGRMLTPDVWRAEMDMARDLADGAIIWDAASRWNEDLPWWTVTRDFLIDSTPIAPAAPSGLGAAVQNAQRINLSWTDNAHNETGWLVQRRLGGSGPFVTVAALGRNTITYADQSVSAASSYTYRVVALNSSAESLASNEAAATTPAGNVAPAAPVSPAAAGESPGAIRVSWIAGSQNHTGFKIERSQGGGSFAEIGIAAAGASTYLDTTAVTGVNHVYRVRAYNGFGNSGYSAEVSGVALLSSKDPRAIWKLDETAGTAADDSVGGDDDGVVAGGATWTSGRLGGALQFDGVDDHIAVADNARLRFAAGEDFTLSAWVNPASLLGGRAGIVTKSGTGISIDTLGRWVFSGPGGDIVGPLATPGWTHVAAVQNGVVGTRKLYVNGVEVASGAAQNANVAGDLWIGGSASANEFFQGKIDDVRVYGEAWTAAELTALANPNITLNGTSGNDTFVVDIDPANRHYRFVVNGATVATALWDAVASVDVTGNAGDDQLTVDFASGDPLPDYGFNFAGGNDRDTLRVAGNRPNISFDPRPTNISLAGRSIVHTNVEALTLSAATATIHENLAMDLKLEAGATATFAAAQKLTGLTVVGGRADVVSQHVAIDYTGAGNSPIAGLAASIAAGRNNGNWNGNGIVTSDPDAQNPTPLTTLVPVEASQFLEIEGSETSSWFGMTVDATTVLLVHVRAGDANLDGAIDGEDYFLIDSGYSSQPGGYSNGDFDLNGVIDADDYWLIDSNYAEGGAPMLSAASENYFAPSAVRFANSPAKTAYDTLLEDATDDIAAV